MDKLEKRVVILKNILKSCGNEEKILHHLSQLQMMKIPVEMLRKTLIARTVRPLSMAKGKIGQKASALLRKWLKVIADSVECSEKKKLTSVEENRLIATMCSPIKGNQSSQQCCDKNSKSSETSDARLDLDTRCKLFKLRLEKQQHETKAKELLSAEHQRRLQCKELLPQLANKKTLWNMQTKFQQSCKLKKQSDYKVTATRTTSERIQPLVKREITLKSKAGVIPSSSKIESAKAVPEISLKKAKLKIIKAKRSPKCLEMKSPVIAQTGSSSLSVKDVVARERNSLSQKKDAEVKAKKSKPKRRRREQLNDHSPSSIGMRRIPSFHKTPVYSGKKKCVPKRIWTLKEICVRSVIRYIKSFQNLKNVPFFLLKPFLESLNAEELNNLENDHRHLADETHDLWERHCKNEFGDACKPFTHETWYQLYWRFHEIKTKTPLMERSSCGRLVLIDMFSVKSPFA